MNPHPDDAATCAIIQLLPEDARRLADAFEQADIEFVIAATQDPPRNEDEGDSPATNFTLTVAVEHEAEVQRIVAEL